MEKLGLYDEKNFNCLRNKGDELADEAVKALIKSPELCNIINSWGNLPEKNKLTGLPEAVQNFFFLFYKKPEFINQNKVKIAQGFFDNESNLYLSLLGFYSLPYCYAFADGAQVLIRSKRTIDDIGRRLSETMVAYFLGKEVSKAVGITQKVKLPKGLYGLLLDLSFIQHGSLNTNYFETRKQFLAQSKLRFGEELALKIPVILRS